MEFCTVVDIFDSSDELDIEVDLHGLTVKKAKHVLTGLLNKLPEKVHSIMVIHGFKHGQSLRNMIRKEFIHSRIKNTIEDLENEGRTIFKLIQDQLRWKGREVKNAPTIRHDMLVSAHDCHDFSVEHG